MAQGVMRSNKTRDGIAASLVDNIGYLEEQMYELEQTDAAAVQAATEAATAAASAVEGAESALTEMDAVLESLSLSRASRLNKPNLIKQNFWTSRNMPSSAVITETVTVPVEDATAAAASLTFTITNEAITSSYVLHGWKISNYNVVSYSSLSLSASAGSATLTISARSGAHDAAVTVTVYICTVASTNVVYGDASRISGTSYPYMNSISDGNYPGDDSVDGIVTTVATLTGNDIVTEVADGSSYDKAIQYAITANSAYGNTEWLMYFYPYGTRTYTQGATNVSNYGQIEEMTPGKTYTVSCWARVTSGTAAWVRFGYGNSYSNAPYNDSTNHRSGLSEWQEVTGSDWQRVWWTFEFNPVGDWYTETSATVDNVTTVTRSYNWYKKVCFGVGRKYTATLQLCGFRLVEGGMWLPTKYDELSERVDELEDDVAADIEGAVSMAQAAVQAAICETDSTTATANHAVGDVFWMNGVLYKATAAIATGETITPGTNCETTTVEEELAAKATSDTITGNKTTRATNRAYEVGELFIMSNKLYRCTESMIHSQLIVPGTNCEETTIEAEIAAAVATLNSNKADKANPIINGSISLGRSGTVGTNSVAIGTLVKATSRNAYAQGFGLIANCAHQHVFGMYNTPDPNPSETNKGTYVEIVGNGMDLINTKNARTLDWAGNESLAGGLTLGKGTADETTITAAQLAQLLALLS